jgi:hypothetical protein
MSLGGLSRHRFRPRPGSRCAGSGDRRRVLHLGAQRLRRGGDHAQSRGVSAEALRTATGWALESLRYTTKEAAAAIESGNHETDSATLSTYAEGGRAGLAAMQAAGLRARLLGAAVESMDAAEAAGFGELGFYVQTKVGRIADG